MIRQAIIKLANKQNLTYDEASQVMNEMMSGETTQVQIAAFLTALAMKGENIEEITGCAAAMRAKGVRLLHNVEALEIVGTGGDQSNSFNISTTSAIVIAQAVCGGKARQQGGFVKERCGRLSGSTWCQHYDYSGTEYKIT